MSAIHATRTGLGPNPLLQGDRPVTKCLCYDTAQTVVVMFQWHTASRKVKHPEDATGLFFSFYPWALQCSFKTQVKHKRAATSSKNCKEYIRYWIISRQLLSYTGRPMWHHMHYFTCHSNTNVHKQGPYTMNHISWHNNSAHKQNHDVWTHQLRGSAVKYKIS